MATQGADEGKPLLDNAKAGAEQALDSAEKGVKDVGSAVVDAAADVIVRFSNQNKRFYGNLYLALAIASWMTLFGLPVYSQTIAYSLFGEKHVIVDGKAVQMCGDNMMGFKVNEGTESKPHLVPYSSAHAADAIVPDVWCGFLPGTYFTAWPGVVQTAMFTLYVNTGTTVKQAWQCIAGTGCAVANVFFMSFLFPQGPQDPNYSEAVAWLDLAIVIFLFLASRADVNTMMMGICWSVCLMIHFMNPSTGPTIGTYASPIPGVNWDGETTVVMSTAILGCIIAIVATLFPRPLTNINRVHDDALEVVKGVEVLFTDAIEYYCQDAPNPKRFQVYAKISALQSTVGRVDSNLADSFWETFNVCHYGKMRRLYKTFNTAVKKSEDELFLVKAACEQLDFNKKHRIFARDLKAPMMDLKIETVKCLKLCARCCRDGKISDDEQKQIEGSVRNIEAKQQDLSNKYQIAMKNADFYIEQDVAADSLFVFSLSQWARELQDWAADLSRFDVKSSETAQGVLRKDNILVIAAKQVAYVFDPYYMFSKESLRFTVMNSIPLLVTYAIAMYSNGSVFIQYSATMPSTLAVLVTYDYGATFFNNLQRLMGVTFGHTLPLLVMSIISLLPCESYLRFALHALSIFVFYFAFTFMYYASDQWSTIGCLVGGFGCYTLFRPCDATSAPDYGYLYKDIAETIVAIMIKMLIATLLSPAEPRDLALDKLKVTFQETQEALETFCKEGMVDGDRSLETKCASAKEALSACEALKPKCDPSLQMVPGFRTPFKLELYGKALAQMRLVLSDVDMLCLAMKGHLVEHEIRNKITKAQERAEDQNEAKSDAEEAAIFNDMRKQPSWETLSGDVMSTLSMSFEVCLAVLAHATEEPLDSRHVDELKKTSNLMQLDGLKSFYSELSRSVQVKSSDEKDIFQDPRIITQLRRTRFIVAINALSLMTTHSATIAANCFEHMLYF